MADTRALNAQEVCEALDLTAGQVAEMLRHAVANRLRAAADEVEALNVPDYSGITHLAMLLDAFEGAWAQENPDDATTGWELWRREQGDAWLREVEDGGSTKEAPSTMPPPPENPSAGDGR